MGALNVVNRQLENAPLPDLIRNLAAAIADGQYAMDMKSIEVFQVMADRENGWTPPGYREPMTLIELGFTPTFYHFTESTFEAKVAFSAMESTEWSIGAEVGVNVKFVSVAISASYTQKYSFESSGSSSVRATIVSVPAPALLGEIISDLRAESAS